MYEIDGLGVVELNTLFDARNAIYDNYMQRKLTRHSAASALAIINNAIDEIERSE